jgi:ribonuclease Z
MNHLRIIGSGGGDLSPSILLNFDQKSYLFNCGEGTQRFCIQHKIKLGKISNVFFTRTSYDSMGGIPGFMLTLETANALQPESKNVSMFGPEGIKEFLDSIRPFTHRGYNARELKFKSSEFTDFMDENIQVSCIRASQSAAKRRCTGFKKYFLSYVIKGPIIKPKFDKEKLKKFNITKPDHFKKLVANQEVELENGSRVTADQVLFPQRPRDVFLILDVTSGSMQDMIEKLENVKSQILGSKEEMIKIIFHIIQDDLVLENPIYQEWMKSWGSIKVGLI